MEAARIKEARRRLIRAWVFGGLHWSTFFLLLALGITWLLSADAVKIVQLALMLALFAFFGLYAVSLCFRGVIAALKRAKRPPKP